MHDDTLCTRELITQIERGFHHAFDWIPPSAQQSQRCYDMSHEPPKHMALAPGSYRHTCPSCKRVVDFVVRGACL